MATQPKLKTAPVVRPWDAPLPDIIVRQANFYYLDRKGVRLRVMHAKTPLEDARGSIIFCPGRTEFIEKYFEATEDFLGRGFDVLILDPRGQGLSDRLLADPLKGHVRRFRDYADDFAFVAEHFAKDLPKPHLTMGHSMGGSIVLLALINGSINPSAFVCCAPMTGIFDVEARSTAIFIRICNYFGLSKRGLPFDNSDGLPVPFKDNKLTSDPERFEKWASYFKTTPELRVAGPTFAWAHQALLAIAKVNRQASKIKIPGLIVAAGADPIVDPASNAEFAKRAGVNLKVIPGARHEIFMERDEYRNQLFESFDAFLEDEGF